jgi:hypothetical protein
MEPEKLYLKSLGLFDSSDPDNNFRSFSRRLDARVRSIGPAGVALVNFQDVYLMRPKRTEVSAMTQSWMSGSTWGASAAASPDFDPFDDATSSASASSSTAQALKDALNYDDLSDAAKSLDLKLFCELQALVTGPKADILDTVSPPIFVKAMIALHMNDKISEFSEKYSAFNALKSVVFTGDAALFRQQLTSVVSHLHELRTTMKDAVIIQIMDSGLPEYARNDVLRELDAAYGDHKTLNLGDAIALICSRVATLNGTGVAANVTQPTQAVQGGQQKCSGCGMENSHSAAECYTSRHVVTREKLDPRTSAPIPAHVKARRQRFNGGKGKGKQDSEGSPSESLSQNFAGMTLQEKENAIADIKYETLMALNQELKK